MELAGLAWLGRICRRIGLRRSAGCVAITPRRELVPAGRHIIKEGRHMSRVTTPQAAPTSPTVKVPHDKIAMRAYEKWCQRGRPQGVDVQCWLEAERELQAEYARTTSNRR
jgi:Protein of unknown function (DUF2934)